MKILTIVGARPQFIKAAAVSRQILKTPGLIEVIVHTGQHYDANMSDVFFDEMKIPKPQYQLGISGLSHGAMTGQMLEKIEEVILKESPDWVMVYGDTNSTLAGALAASKLHVRVAHIEAGLRSFNMNMPEEVNRILTDRVSTVLCCPTETAIKNLQNEGYANFSGVRVVNTGDVMQDVAVFYKSMSKKPTSLPSGFLDTSPFALSTLHRAENTDDPSRLTSILRAIAEIGRETPVVLPLHPRTRKKIESLDSGLLAKVAKQVVMIEPVGYLEMIYLLEHSSLVLTDSGGLQKEAFFFGKPCVTMRDETEWVELVEHGFNVLAGANSETIIAAAKKMGSVLIDASCNLYGGGRASAAVVGAIQSS